jgi:ferritin-like metal-binding protein YciE
MEKADPAIIDLMIAGSAQRVEHYEKAVYTGLHEMASFMKHEKVAGLLKETLDEEVAASKKVASISKILLKSVPIGHEVK